MVACRQAARQILDRLLDDIADCHVTKAEDPSADLDACIQAATEQQRTRLREHLQAQFEDGLSPSECLPVLCAAAGALLSSPAVSAWQKISSPHFVIYADDSPEKLREFASRLERFDKAVRLVRGMSDPALGDGNRLTVFVVPDIKDVQRLAGTDHEMTTNLAGFYRADGTGSIAVVPKRSGDREKPWMDDQETFFHEYAHHLMMQELSRPYPEWLVEGFAEFMSTAIFERDGSVGLGAPALHRGRCRRSSRSASRTLRR